MNYEWIKVGQRVKYQIAKEQDPNLNIYPVTPMWNFEVSSPSSEVWAYGVVVEVRGETFSIKPDNAPNALWDWPKPNNHEHLYSQGGYIRPVEEREEPDPPEEMPSRWKAIVNEL